MDTGITKHMEHKNHDSGTLKHREHREEKTKTGTEFETKQTTNEGGKRASVGFFRTDTSHFIVQQPGVGGSGRMGVYVRIIFVYSRLFPCHFRIFSSFCVLF